MYVCIDIGNTKSEVREVYGLYDGDPKRLNFVQNSGNVHVEVLNYNELNQIIMNFGMDPDSEFVAYVDCEKVLEWVDPYACPKLAIVSFNVTIGLPGTTSPHYTWTEGPDEHLLALNTSGSLIDGQIVTFNYNFINATFPETNIIAEPKPNVRIDCKNNSNIKRIYGNRTLVIENLIATQKNININIIDVVCDIYNSSFTGWDLKPLIGSIYGTLSNVDVTTSIHETFEYPNAHGTSYTSSFGSIPYVKNACNIIVKCTTIDAYHIFAGSAIDGETWINKCEFYATSIDGVVGINSNLLLGIGDTRIKNSIIEFKSLHDKDYRPLPPYNDFPTITVPKINPVLTREKINNFVKIWGISDNRGYRTNWISNDDYSKRMHLIQGGEYMAISDSYSYARGAHDNVLAVLGTPTLIPNFSFEFHNIKYDGYTAEYWRYNDTDFYRVWKGAPDFTRPILSSGFASQVTHNSARSNTAIGTIGTVFTLRIRFRYSTTSAFNDSNSIYSPYINVTSVTSGEDDTLGRYNYIVTGLEPNTLYYQRTETEEINGVVYNSGGGTNREVITKKSANQVGYEVDIIVTGIHAAQIIIEPQPIWSCSENGSITGTIKVPQGFAIGTFSIEGGCLRSTTTLYPNEGTSGFHIGYNINLSSIISNVRVRVSVVEREW
jgi:hypothetical protein